MRRHPARPLIQTAAFYHKNHPLINRDTMSVPDRITVKVPATTANLGPGFDAMGMALDLWNTVTVTPGNSEVSIEGEGEDELPRDESNIVVAGIQLGPSRPRQKRPGACRSMRKPHPVEPRPWEQFCGDSGRASCWPGDGRARPGPASSVRFGRRHRGPPRQRGSGRLRGMLHQREEAATGGSSIRRHCPKT